jgi:nucleoside-diphosphate-sugar epimerase
VGKGLYKKSVVKSFWEILDMSSCIVTGGVGFIGSHLIKPLLKCYDRVIVADKRLPDESPILSMNNSVGWEYRKIDLRDSKKTSKLFKSTKPDVVYHLAAQPLSIKSNIDPLNTAHDNIMGTYSVLEALRNHSPASRLVYASTACFFGAPLANVPLKENDAPAVGRYIYTATKIAADYAVQHYRNIYHMNCFCVRMVNVYGPGEMHLERIVPRLTMQALKEEPPTLTRSDGSDILSFIFITDIVKALLLFGEHKNATDEPIWNIAGPSTLSILELMKIIYRIAGFPIKSFAATGTHEGEPIYKYLDGNKIKQKLGFYPDVSIERGLKNTFNWYKKHFKTEQTLIKS